MSEEQKQYSLVILFDSTQITLEDLKVKAENTLQKYSPETKPKLENSHCGSILLTIRGALEVVDACHEEINKLLINQSQLKGIRILDEAGDEIRQRAYPILAEIEQRFRVFVSQAIVEVCGFDWWATLAPTNIRSKVQTIYEKHRNNGTVLNFLECTQFDDLIQIITAEVSDWSENKPIQVVDFLELLSGCDSTAEIKTKIEQKLTKFSFWNVFARYFQDRKQWEQIKQSINFVINERHKVMHHRPIQYSVLNALSAKKTEILSVLDSAKPELSEQERTEAQQEIRDKRETISVHNNGLRDFLQQQIPPIDPLTKLWEEHQRQQQSQLEQLRSYMQPQTPPINPITKLWEQHQRQQQSQLEQLIASMQQQIPPRDQISNQIDAYTQQSRGLQKRKSKP